MAIRTMVVEALTARKLRELLQAVEQVFQQPGIESVSITISKRAAAPPAPGRKAARKAARRG
jgi:hypothetical protein